MRVGQHHQGSFKSWLWWEKPWRRSNTGRRSSTSCLLASFHSNLLELLSFRNFPIPSFAMRRLVLKKIVTTLSPSSFIIVPALIITMNEFWPLKYKLQSMIFQTKSNSRLICNINFNVDRFVYPWPKNKFYQSQLGLFSINNSFRLEGSYYASINDRNLWNTEGNWNWQHVYVLKYLLSWLALLPKQWWWAEKWAWKITTRCSSFSCLKNSFLVAAYLHPSIVLSPSLSLSLFSKRMKKVQTFVKVSVWRK